MIALLAYAEAGFRTTFNREENKCSGIRVLQHESPEAGVWTRRGRPVVTVAAHANSLLAYRWSNHWSG